MGKKFGPDRGRRECFHEVRTAMRTYKVEIRFDRNEGNFFAQFTGREFADTSIKKLQERLCDEAGKADSVQWERWIQYELIDHGYSSYQRYHQGNEPLVGLKFECVDLSIPEEGVARRHISRRVDDQGNVVPLDERFVGDLDTFLGDIWDKRSKDKIIRFTPDRWAALKQIQAVIIDARRKLGQLLDADEPDDVENQLDSMTTPLLMAGPMEDEDERPD